MNRHYDKSRPISATLLTMGSKIFAGLAVLLLVLSLASAALALGSDDQVVTLVLLALATLPLGILSAVCFGAYRAAKRGSLQFMWWVAGAFAFITLTTFTIGRFFEGFRVG